jgi:hypothetical protein
MTRLLDCVWFFFWGLPFALLGMLCAHLTFIIWSAQFEFKCGYNWTLKRRVAKGKRPSGGGA